MRSFQTKSRLTRKEKPKKSNRDTAKRIRKAMQNQSNGRTIRGGKLSEYLTNPQKMLAVTRLKRIHNSIVNAANRYNEQASILMKNSSNAFPPYYPEEIKSGTTIMFYSGGKIDVNAPVTEFRVAVCDTDSVNSDDIEKF
jgi:hypothetical protein